MSTELETLGLSQREGMFNSSLKSTLRIFTQTKNTVVLQHKGLNHLKAPSAVCVKRSSLCWCGGLTLTISNPQGFLSPFLFSGWEKNWKGKNKGKNKSRNQTTSTKTENKEEMQQLMSGGKGILINEEIKSQQEMRCKDRQLLPDNFWNFPDILEKHPLTFSAEHDFICSVSCPNCVPSQPAAYCCLFSGEERGKQRRSWCCASTLHP